jgi:hypothetical protein
MSALDALDIIVSALDSFGRIPEFKFCAAKVEKAAPRMEAAE